MSAKLSWTEHVTRIVSKANRAGKIRRNINVAPMQAKSQAYQTLVRPYLEYGSSLSDPNTQTDVNRIEAVQLVLQDSDSTDTHVDVAQH